MSFAKGPFKRVGSRNFWGKKDRLHRYIQIQLAQTMFPHEASTRSKLLYACSKTVSANMFVVFEQAIQIVGHWYTYHILCFRFFHSTNPSEKKKKKYMHTNNTLFRILS